MALADDPSCRSFATDQSSFNRSPAIKRDDKGDQARSARKVDELNLVFWLIQCGSCLCRRSLEGWLQKSEILSP